MVYNCPLCNVNLDVNDSVSESNDIVCESCGSKFLLRKKMTFLYGVMLAKRDDNIMYFECPYCEQHYSTDEKINRFTVYCDYCHKLFAVPPELRMSEEEIITSSVYMPQDEESMNNESYFTEEAHNATVRCDPEFDDGSGQDVVPESVDNDNYQAQESLEEYKNMLDKPSTLIDNSENEAPELQNVAKEKQSIATLLGNILWISLGGFIGAMVSFVYGALACCTLIGIPLGLQLFKLGNLQLSPFGADIYRKQQGDKVGCICTFLNIIWIVSGGLAVAINSFILGIIFCCTIIGIPFGLQYFKIGTLMFTPFGLEVRRKASMLPAYIVLAIVNVVFFVLLYILLVANR